MVLGRARGRLLRLVRQRETSILVGLALIVPSAWVEFGGRSFVWWADGVATVAGATGVALFWIGVTGARPDWIDRAH